MSVLREMERLFLHTDHRVISAFAVIKCQTSIQTRGRSKPPQPNGKPRVICITVQRRTKSRGFKASFHICKGEPGRYEVRKTIRLKLITRLEAFHLISSSDSIVEISLQQRAFTGGESRLAFETVNPTAQVELIGVLYSFCKSHEKKSPPLVGITRSDLGIYANLDDEDEEGEEGPANGVDALDDNDPKTSSPMNVIEDEDQQHSGTHTNDESSSMLDDAPSPHLSTDIHSMHSIKRDLTSFHSMPAHRLPLDMHQRHSAGATYNNENAPATGPGALVATSTSIQEAAAAAAWAQHDTKIAALLESVAGGASSMEEAQNKIDIELSALQDANVHELLESSAAAIAVQDEINKTLSFVDDLEDVLGMFDAKLHDIQEDLSVIEEWNNKLDAYGRDNNRLLNVLENMTTILTLSKETETVLKNCEIKSETLEMIVAAAWDLNRHLQAIESGNMSSHNETTTIDTTIAIDTSSKSNGRPLKSLSAVRSRQKELQGIAQLFLHKATAYISNEFQHLADALISSVSTLQSSDRIRAVSHSSLHQKAKQIKPLLDVVGHLQPGAAATLRMQYCSSVNALLMKEIGGAVKELYKHAVVAANVSSTIEPEISLKSASSSAKTIERISSSYRHNTNTNDHQLTPSTSAPIQPQSSLRSMHSRQFSLGGGPGSILRGNNNPHSRAPIDPGVPIEEAFQLVVSTFFPMLSIEVDKCSAFTCTGATPSEIDAAHRVLLKGVQESVLHLLDAVQPSKVLPCLSIIGICLHWQSKLRKHPGSKHVCDILCQCQIKMNALWDAYIADKVAGIKKYDGKSSMGGSIMRSVHVMPFIVSIEAVASKIEGVVSEWMYKDGVDASGSRGGGVVVADRDGNVHGGKSPRTPTSPPPVLTAPTTSGNTASTTTNTNTNNSNNNSSNKDGKSGDSKSGSALMMPSPFELSAGGMTTAMQSQHYDKEKGKERKNMHTLIDPTNNSATTTTITTTTITTTMTAVNTSTIEKPGAALRRLADTLYEHLLHAMLAAVESHAAADPKHGPRLRLENYSFLRLSLQGLPLGQTDVLSKYCSHAASLRNQCLTSYVDQMVENIKFDKVVQLSSNTGTDINATEAQQILAVAATGLEKKLITVKQRLQKHFGSSSPYLIDVVWERFEMKCTRAWESAGKIVPPSSLGLSVGELKSVFGIVKKDSD